MRRPVVPVSFENGRPTVPADWLARRFDLSEADLRREMRAGRITSLLERGEGADAGRLRLTFRRDAQACALVVEADGRAHEVAPPAPQPALFRMIDLARAGGTG